MNSVIFIINSNGLPFDYSSHSIPSVHETQSTSISRSPLYILFLHQICFLLVYDFNTQRYIMQNQELVDVCKSKNIHLNEYYKLQTKEDTDVFINPYPSTLYHYYCLYLVVYCVKKKQSHNIQQYLRNYI